MGKIKKLLEPREFVIVGSLDKNSQEGALYRAWGHAFSNHLIGDYVEFGVYKVDSFVESYKQYFIFNKWLISQTKSTENWRRKVAVSFIESQLKFEKWVVYMYSSQAILCVDDGKL